MIGSAQIWMKGRLLQHGEIPLNAPQDIWREIFKSASPNSILRSISKESLEKKLFTSIKQCLPNVDWEIKPISKEELVEVKLMENKYYVEVN